MLVRAVADTAAAHGFTVLWGAGLRFGAVQSTCLPFVMAFEGWLRGADQGSRDALVAAVDEVAHLLPSLGGSPGAAAPATMMLTVDAILGPLARTDPVLLVVDDVQWADPLSRDCLTYLLAGGEGRGVAVALTCRDEDVEGDGTGLGNWLADVRRLPGCGSSRSSGWARGTPRTSCAGCSAGLRTHAWRPRCTSGRPGSPT